MFVNTDTFEVAGAFEINKINRNNDNANNF